MGKCTINKEALNEIFKNDVEKDNLPDNDPINQIDTDEATRKVISLITGEYKIGEFVDLDYLHEKFIKEYGKDSEREFISAAIMGIMEAYPGFKGEIFRFIREIAGESGTKVGVTVVRDKKEVKRMDISRLSVTNLMTIYNFALQPKKWQNKKSIFRSNETVAYFDGYFARKLTPRRRAMREPSGGFVRLAKATEDHVTNVASRINKFTSDHVIDDAQGMNKVINDVGKIGTMVKKTNGRSKTIALFARYMSGWIELNENNEFMIYEHYLEEMGEDGKPTGLYKHYNPILLKEYTPPNGKKGDFYVELTEEQIDKFLHLSKEARKITDKLWEYMKEEMQLSLDKLMDTLVNAFEGTVSPERLKMLFFKGKTEIQDPRTGEITNLLEDFTDNDLKLYNQLKDVFAYSINDDFVMANGGKSFQMDTQDTDPIYKQRYWPIVYDRQRFLDVLNVAIQKAETEIGELSLAVETEKDNEGNELSDAAVIIAMKMLKDKISRLRHLTIVRKRLIGMKVDNAANAEIPFGYVSDNKHFKSVSNAFDIHQMRVDEGVFYDYIKFAMTAIQRNILASELVQSLVDSRRINKPGMHDAVSNAALNLYKVIYNDPTVEGAFSRGPLSGILGSTEKLNDALNRIRPWRKKTPEQTQRTLNAIKGAITGLYLSGLGTTAQNFIDMGRNIQDSGFNQFTDALKLYFGDKEDKKKINRLIEMSGILDFSDFFSQAMVNGIVDVQLEEKVSAAIIKEMIDYHYRIKRGMKASKSEAIFRENIKGYLEQSTAFTTAEEFVIMDLEETKAAKYQNKQSRIATRVNRLVEHAIRHQYVIAPVLKNKSALKNWTKYFAMKPLEFTGAALGMWNSSLRALNLTMDNTEKMIRSLSFVIGAQMAQDSDMLHNNIPWYELDINRKKIDSKTKKLRPLDENERALELQDINTVLQWGKERNYKTNFQLSTQGAGANFYGEIGKLWGTFKNWSTQKFGSDVRKFLQAYFSYKSFGKSKDNLFDRKAASKTFSSIFTAPINTKEMRANNAAGASFVDFMRIQGTITIAMDLAAIGAGPIGLGLRAAMFTFGGKQLKGFTSDLVSLMFMPLMLGFKFAWPDDDDNEDWDRWVQYYIRKLPNLGFTPIWGMDVIWAIINASREQETKTKQNLVNFSRPFIGGGTLFGDIATEYITKNLWEYLHSFDD
jgi:hypothetical protein